MPAYPNMCDSDSDNGDMILVHPLLQVRTSLSVNHNQLVGFCQWYML